LRDSAPFVVKNFNLFVTQRRSLRTKVGGPYAYVSVTHEMSNHGVSYCTQKSRRLQRGVADERDDPASEAHTKETDSIVITGGEPTLRADIEELVEAARFECSTVRCC